MDAALADEAEPARGLGFAAIAVDILHVRVGGIVREDSGLAGRKADRQLHMLHRRGIAAVDAERLEQIPETELQPSDPRIGPADLRRHAQRAWCLDVDEQADRPGDSPCALEPRERVAGGTNVIGRLHHREIHEIEVGTDDGFEVGMEMHGRQGIDANDQDLAVGAAIPPAQKRRDRIPRLGLAAFRDGVLEIDGDGVGVPGHRFGEQLGPRPRDE